MVRHKIMLACAVCLWALAGSSAPAWAGAKTGILEKKEVEGKTVEVFTDTAYGYKISTPEGWDMSIQKEDANGRNPLRVRMRMKDKQVPSQLWDAQNLVTNAQIYVFIVDVDWPATAVRDSLESATFTADWQKPIVKNCDIIREGQVLQTMDLRWENDWLGAGYSLQKQYTAQIPTGEGLYRPISEVLLGEFYVFQIKGHKLLMHLVSEREFLEDNRNIVKQTLYQMGSLKP